MSTTTKASFQWDDALLLEQQLTDDERAVRDAARAYCQDKLAPRVLEAFRNEKTDPSIFREMGELGLLGVTIPTEYGGSGLNYVSYGLVAREVERVDSGYRSMMSVQHSLVMVPINEFGTEATKRKYLPKLCTGEYIGCFGLTEPNHGSDPGSMITRATKVEGGYKISGSKMWISNALSSDIMQVQAVTDADKRQRGGITMFIVEKGAPGLNIEEGGIRTWLGSRSAQYVVHFDNVFVPDANVLGDIGNGFRLGQRWLTIHDRLLRAPQALGRMQRALDLSVDWAKQRVTFGKPLSERQAIQWRLVDMHVDIEALRAMTYSAAARGDRGEDVRHDASLVKFTAGEWGARTLDHAIQIHGAMGEALELPLTVFYRLLRHLQIGGGTTEMQKMLIARELLK